MGEEKKTVQLTFKSKTCEEYVLNELYDTKKVNELLRSDLNRVRLEKSTIESQLRIKLDECCDSYEAQVKERDKKIAELERIVRALCNATYAEMTEGERFYLAAWKTDANKETYDMLEKLVKDLNPNLKIKESDNEKL